MPGDEHASANLGRKGPVPDLSRLPPNGVESQNEEVPTEFPLQQTSSQRTIPFRPPEQSVGFDQLPAHANDVTLHDLWTNMTIDEVDVEALVNEQWLSHDLISFIDSSALSWNNVNVLPGQEETASCEIQETDSQCLVPEWPPAITQQSPNDRVQSEDTFEDISDAPDTSDARIRMASPVDESTNLDHIPFAWNASSGRLRGEFYIEIDDHDPLYAHKTHLHSISAEALRNLQDEYQHALSTTEPLRRLQLPAVPVANVLLGLYYQHFYPQAPAIHRRVNVSKLHNRPYLITIMLAIGAVYSGKKGGRRFAVYLFEESRRCFQAAIDKDNKLMRDALTVYAGYLICFTGLWCGNKRAFELAEALRGQLVTLARRIQPSIPNDAPRKSSVEEQWSTWVDLESRRRICWLIYTLDAQFPVLLHIPSMMSLVEVLEWLCPCEDEFWHAPSAKHWKSLLGPASEPPAKSFSAVIVPFMDPDLDLSMLRLNAWSSLLVIITIGVQVFNYAQGRDERSVYHELYDIELPDDTILHSRLAAGLRRWRSEYRAAAGRFMSIADMYHETAHFLLHVSIRDLQDLIGKSGKLKIERAQERLRIAKIFQMPDDSHSDPPPNARREYDKTSSRHRDERQQSSMQSSIGPEDDVPTADSRKLITEAFRNHVERDYLSRKDPFGNTPSELTPYTAVAFFLTSLYFYAYSLVATEPEREAFRDYIGSISQNGGESIAYDILRCGFDARPPPGAAETPNNISAEPAKLFLRYGASRLIDYGGWGCSIGLGLLLHWRSKI
ncbi:Fungal specific transcription factor domain-containing protein 9 [Elsinoe fawcettii]|nr:Fungal specific transcription factor domain-containing protein 9 [Elsinoe fawcettii]